VERFRLDEPTERFIDEVGFLSCLTDARRPGPSLYIAVCGRRDAVLPRNVQKDPESSETWLLKDELVRRGKVYYAKMARGKAMFLAPAMIPHFNAIWGVRKADEARRLSPPARRILKVLRAEWEMATADLRAASGVDDRARFTKAIEELQTRMKVVAGEVEDASGETNMSAYLAVGIWHHWLIRRDRRYVERFWPVVRRALDFVEGMQLSFGGIAWSQEWHDGAPAGINRDALVAGSSSIYQSLRAGVALAEGFVARDPLLLGDLFAAAALPLPSAEPAR